MAFVRTNLAGLCTSLAKVVRVARDARLLDLL